MNLTKKIIVAIIGTGKIGFAAMKEIADYCKSKGVPMLVE